VDRAPHSLTRLRVSGARPNVRRVLALTGLDVGEAPADLP
jgi:hypothetical protein